MRHFVAVAEERHFGRAAERLHMAQPPLSQSIRRLELELGVQLLDRSRRGVFLTGPGAVFLEEARRTLLQANLTREITQRTAKSDMLRLNIGFIGPALYRALPQIVAAHRAKYKDVDVRLIDRSTPDQITGIIDGTLDVAFIFNSPDWVEGGEKLVVERCPLVLATPSDSHLAQRESINLEDLADEPFIAIPPGSSPHLWQLVTSAFRAAGCLPRVVQEASQTSTILSLVANGLGSALVPAIAELEGRRNVSFIPVANSPANLVWEISVIWRPQHISASAQTFIEETRAFAERTIASPVVAASE